MDPLFKQYHFKDSMLFTSDTLPLSILPKNFDSIKFKIFTKKEIFLLMQTENDLNKLPNYLNIGAFEKNDSAFYIRIGSLGTAPFGEGGTIGMDIPKKQ